LALTPRARRPTENEQDLERWHDANTDSSVTSSPMNTAGGRLTARWLINSRTPRLGEAGMLDLAHRLAGPYVDRRLRQVGADADTAS